MQMSYIQWPTRWASVGAGRSDDDQRHRFTLDGNIRMPHGFQLGGATQHYSPLPLNAATGSNTIPGTTARPAPGGVFIGRNVHSGFAFTTVSGRLSRSHAVLERWKVTAMAEAFGAGTYPASPLPAFGTPTAVGDPRS